MTLADERWVPPDHEASNERLVRRHLLVQEAAAAELISLKTPEPTPDLGQESAGLDRTTRRTCLAVRPPAAPHPRMSLTLAAILDSRRLVLHITGESKMEVVRRAMEPGPVEDLPIRGVLASGRVEVWWAPAE